MTYSSAKVDNPDEFEKLLRDGCFKLIETEGKYGSYYLPHANDFWAWLTRDRSYSYFEWGEYAVLLHYAFLYADKCNDYQLLTVIQSKFDKYFLFRDFFVERQDQVAYGNVAIDLYLKTQKPCYRLFADRLFAHLDSLDRNEGMILYREGMEEQHVDAIGLVCPFLFYYSDVFKNQHAADMGEKMISEYVKWGTDDVTGIPVQTYNIKNHIKCNHANWGRGVAWYLIGTRNIMSKDTLQTQRIGLLEQTLLNNTSDLYTQYLGQKGEPDMSATIPIIFHLYEKGLFSVDRKQLFNLIRPYCDSDGIIRYGSPSISYPHEEVDCTRKAIWAQSILLYFFSICKSM